MKKIKTILLIFIGMLLLILGIGTVLYKFNTDFYILLKYGNDVFINEYFVNDDLDIINSQTEKFKNSN